MDSGRVECHTPLFQLPLTVSQETGEVEKANGRVLLGQQDAAEGTVRIKDPWIVALREDHSDVLGQDDEEGVERQKGVVTALTSVGAMKYWNRIVEEI